MFKRLRILPGLVVLLLCIGAFTTTAADVHELLPRNAFWQGTPDGGAYVMLEESGESFLFYTFDSKKIPSTQAMYSQPVVISTADHSLVYHFTVKEGSCAIQLLLEGKNGETVALSLSNVLGMGEAFESGVHKGALPLSQLCSEKEAVFLGLRVEIMGSKLQIFDLEAMADKDVPEDVSENQSSADPLPPESEGSIPAEESEKSLTPEESRDAIFVSKDEVSFSETTNAATTMFVTTLSIAGIIIAVAIGISLFRRTRPYS